MTSAIKARRLKRLITLERALVEGARLEDLVQAAVAGLGCSRKTGRADVKLLLERLADEGRAIRPGVSDPVALAVAVKRRERIFQEAMRHKDRRIALDAEKDRCRLLNVYPHERPEDRDTVEDESLVQLIERELARLAKARAAQAAQPAEGDEPPPTAADPAG